jgi:NAD(P)-dependent dehydrogenase (short-subunit alcohol dehydrogenase family)
VSVGFDGLDVVVTGGTGALGRAVVGRLIEQGAVCHVPAWSAEEVARFDLADHARVRVTEGVDGTDEDSVSSYFAALPRLWGSIHVVGGFAMAPLLETAAADFRRMFELNAVTAFLSCREAARAIRRSGGGGGRIVNVAARPALSPTGGMIAYTTSKAAVVAMTRSLADELVGDHILVNAIAPSVMDTPSNRLAMPAADFAKWPKVEEVATAISYLASPANALTTGLVMPVYGRA